jgi:galactokinase
LTEVVASSAPGRVNLIGEHTDYNGGFVLPMAIPQRTHVELRRTGGRHVLVESAGMGEPVTYQLGGEARGRGWVDYVQGVTDVLSREGHRVGGCELRIRSDVPVGSGLSSSAALAVSVLRAMRAAFALALDDVQLALVAQKVETDFVGAPVGVMDQMASSLADERTALFIDTRTLRYEKVPLPPGIAVLVIDSGIQHSHATGDYRARRRECEEAARALGIAQLRDATDAHVSRIAALPEPLSRRARHVVSENLRVLAAVDAMRTGDAERLGALFRASHASMRDDFAVSTAEIDRLVAIATDTPGVLGARLTGGGFGGAIVALSRIRGCTENAAAIIEAAQRAGLRPSLLV